MSSLNVMIVEDEPIISMAMEMLVEDMGGSVAGTFAAVGPAVAAIEAGMRVDVALLDCNIGKDHSWPVADALAARGIPFAFSSGKGVQDIVERFADRPVFAKPVDDERLKRFLRQFARQA
jgi:CheY-like chemotaxis protein